MAMKETIIKKLQQATCDKTELNKSREMAEVFEGSGKGP